MSRRSTTGCGVCKARHKKCDETKPQCLRCLASRSSCNYEYVEYPESEAYRIKRTKPASRTNRELVVKASKSIPGSPYGVPFKPSAMLPDSGASTTPTGPVPLEMWGGEFCLAMPRRAANNILSLPYIPSDPSKPSPDSNLSFPSLNSSARIFQELDPDEDSDDDNDPEGVRIILCRAPRADRNIKENTLPFVLYCYSQWAIATIFEPLKVTHKIRDQVISQFSSENTRTKSILIANVMNICGSAKEQNAVRILDNMLEIIAIQLDTHPLSNCVQSLENAACIFRRACPELPGRSINLPNLLLDLSLNLRHFATMDIIKSVATGLPTCFQYEVPFSLELCDRVYHWQLQGNYGLQWLYGLPDQYIMLFAWINTLSETPGAGVNTKLITWIESQLPQIKVAIDESGDPSLRIGRMMVLESWRFTVPIYLYMVLCKANANDVRVIRAQKGFMRLLRTVKPGRNPDAYLIISMAVVGAATVEERDRETLRQRILSVREYAECGTAGNDVIRMLEDIWARTRDEGRAAVWSDLRIAYSRNRGK
ncbi:hypothetical protein OPQ81_009159 [Rhizoctonia solani]|nr:hypothetical protein OPQ81_009159 [Rhizoctonia solani]